MHVIICGAGLVGREIARQLAQEKHDVTVVDNSPELLRDIDETLDVRTVTGHGSHPKTLEKAGAADAELLIAVTQSDEINMLTCQVAYSLFQVSRRIARIRSLSYAGDEWRALFSDQQVPVSDVVSPEIETSRAVIRRLTLPGAFEALDFAAGKLRLAGVAVSEDCPIVRTRLDQLPDLFPGLRIAVCGIARNGQMNIAESNDQLEPGDDVYFLANVRDMNRALAIFGRQEQEAKRVLIAGASDIGLYTAQELARTHRQVKFKIIEETRPRAIHAADQLKRGLVLHGSPRDAELLREAGIRDCDAFAALSPNDEHNILAALIAKHEGCPRVICLYNNRSYGPLMRRLGIDAYLSPRTITVSSVLQHVRKGRITNLHAVHDGAAEVIEVEALPTSRLAGQPIKDLPLPEGVRVCAVWRDSRFITPDPLTEIRPGDRVILFALAGTIRRLENLFQVDIEFF